MRTVIVYGVGDWVRGTGSEIGSFMRICRRHKISDKDHCYDVEFYSDVFTDSGLEYVGHDIGLDGSRLRLLTDPKDILLCLASDLKKKQHQAFQDAEKLTKDIDALMHSRDLLGEKTCLR